MAVETALKERWATALESGEYDQGNGSLQDNGKFCCLGVLCDISGRGEWIDENDGRKSYYLTDRPVYEELSDDEAEEFDEEYWHNGSELPGKLLDEIGLAHEAQCDLIRRNDGTGDFNNDPWTFAQIAAYIRKNL
jgi:hypothetical protein